MLKRTQLVLVFMLVFSGAVLLGNTPVGAQDTTLITGASFDGGQIVTSLSGQTPIDPCYNPNPDDPLSDCEPMYPAERLYICNEEPVEGLGNCLPFNFSTLGVAYNTWITFGGRSMWIAP